ncbi:RagB/SusD family nutrient uptake outer membrane protein [Bacteroides heparinolyticus]|uniref:RagB/SusD family nutrient uptake outer membrane protein n=1 Tax=Prevotella heparinolytica TaxID=28113 RepID=UPI0035A17D7F
MKKYKILTVAALLTSGMAMTSCGDDFLTASSTEKQMAGAAATESTILSNLGSAYQILLFDSYANNNYNGILFMSDLRSDDLYKGGGDAGDQAALYSLSQFRMSASESLGGLWSIYFTGLARCNNAIISCVNAEGVKADKLKQYNAEAHFLRAYYVHLLWKFFGNIPYFDTPLQDPYMTKQLSADEVYAKIMADLEVACEEGAMAMSNNSGADRGRACRAAALMLKARVIMYQKEEARYAEVANDMATIIKSGKFSLMDSFDAIWLDENEFCNESIFESNQMPEGKTWSSGWQGYGTNLPAFISPNELNDPNGVFKGGWGFGPVRQAAYDMYEEGDLRRDASINDWRGASYGKRFQDTGLFQRKYAARIGYNPPPGDTDLNYCNNLRIFRYAETLLNYVELVKMHGVAEQQGVDAQESFNLIRKRAFGADKPLAAVEVNIKAERRKEFLGEGMRFYDLVRWGDAVTVLTENDVEHNSVRTYDDNKKLIPIPLSEMEKTKGTEFELKQNPGY